MQLKNGMAFGGGVEWGGRKEESGVGNRVGEKMCCQPPGVRRQVGFKNRDVRCSTFSHGRCWDMNPMLPPVKPELELGSGHEYRTPLEFPEILGVDSGISHRKGKRKQSLFCLNLQR